MGDAGVAISPDVNAQSYDAHQPPFAQPIQFALSGTGQLPQTQEAAQGAGGQPAASGDQSANGTPAANASSTRPGGGLGIPDDPGDNNSPQPQQQSAPPNGVLSFSRIGQKAVQETIAGRTTIDVTMEAIAFLEEVLVTAYTTERRADITGAVSSVSPTAAPNQLLISTLSN